MTEPGKHYEEALAYGFNAAAEHLLTNISDCAPSQRLPTIKAVEFFEAERDKIMPAVDWAEINGQKW